MGWVTEAEEQFLPSRIDKHKDARFCCRPPEELESFRSEWKTELLHVKKQDTIVVEHATVKAVEVQGKKSPDAEETSVLPKPALEASPPPTSVHPPVNASSAASSTTSSSIKRSEKTEKALLAYKEASQYEREGNLSEALIKYREASRLFPDIDQLAREQLRISPKALDLEGTDSFQTYYTLTETPAVTDAEPLELDYSECQFMAEIPELPVLMAKLPDEVIGNIIFWSMVLDFNAIIRIAMVCKRMCHLTRSKTLWKQMCHHFHKESSQALLDENRLTFKNDWLNMWLDKPRIRYDGIYISRVNYIREGYTESFNKPLLIVTYYRYIKFLPGSLVKFWRTPLEPAVAVKEFNADPKTLKGMSTGTFSISAGNIFMTTDDPDQPLCRFSTQLKLTSSRRGRHNKLSWVDFSYVDKRKPDKIDIRSSQLKPFAFSKVKSFMRPSF
ncbi:hypothetical protein HDU97_000460 [Phlyctochytrium planicorne]|nr:hypothetical protein HDU97_000460 [Phlyctochytrium planicorne]